MKATTKKKICIANAILSAVAFLLIYATVWLSRGETLQWIYLDGNIIYVALTTISLAFAIGGIFVNHQKKSAKGQIITSAIINAIPATMILVEFALAFPLDSYEVLSTWRLLPAIGLYYVSTVLYLIVAFVKTKQEDKADEPIPYSD